MTKHYRNFEEEHPVSFSDEFTSHMHAMTQESLHSKSEIALELAYRDMENQALQRRIKELEQILNETVPKAAFVDKMCKAFGVTFEVLSERYSMKAIIRKNQSDE